MFVGIDQSKRSTAAVCIDSAGELVDFIVISPPMYLDGVELLVYQWAKLDTFVYNYHKYLEGIALEGLSFNSVSSDKDLLSGLFWHLRTMLFVEYPSIPVGVCPVLAWRSKVLSKEERKALSLVKVKDGLKKAVVGKLPFGVRVKFEEYIRERGLKKESIWDLADAFFIAQYRLGLEE